MCGFLSDLVKLLQNMSAQLLTMAFNIRYTFTVSAGGRKKIDRKYAVSVIRCLLLRYNFDGIGASCHKQPTKYINGKRQKQFIFDIIPKMDKFDVIKKRESEEIEK